MTLVIAPLLSSPLEPCVGVFWVLTDTLLVDRSTLPEAESYGDCLTHSGGHYELWERWQAAGAAALRFLGYTTKILSSEYDAWPRGRVVFETIPMRFIIYADRRLQRTTTVSALTKAFGLTESRHVVRSDPHYRKSVSQSLT